MRHDEQTVRNIEELMDSLKGVVKNNLGMYGLSYGVELAIKNHLAARYTHAQNTQRISCAFIQGNYNSGNGRSNNNKAVPRCMQKNLL